MRVFDFHIHCGSFPQWDLHLSIEDLLEMMRRDGIAGAAVFGDLCAGDTDPRRSLPLLEAGKVHKQLFPFHWANLEADFHTDALDRQLAYIENYNHLIFGLKYHPSISQVSVNDERLLPLWNFWSKTSGSSHVVLVHSGRLAISDGQNVLELAQRYENVTWVIAHLGGGVFDKIMECLYFYSYKGIPRNLFFDVSQTTHSCLFERALRIVGADHLLYGSDEPFLDSRLVRNTIEYSVIGEESRQKIFFGNAERIFGERLRERLELSAGERKEHS
jgi:hypothetical protein